MQQLNILMEKYLATEKGQYGMLMFSISQPHSSKGKIIDIANLASLVHILSPQTKRTTKNLEKSAKILI